MPKSMYIWIVASHSDKPINGRIYEAGEMAKQVETWTKPYCKPVLRHHDQTADAIGRVEHQIYVPKDQWDAVKKQLNLNDSIPFPEGQTGQIVIRQRITDEDQVKKIEDGRYYTVSVGFSAEHIYCSICNTDWVYDHCEHQPGMEYDGKVQYGIPRNIVYNEISFVNVPADDHAFVVKHEQQDSDDAVIMANASFRYITDTQNYVSQVSETAVQPEVVDNKAETVQQEVKHMDNTEKQEYEALKKQYEELKSAYDSLMNEIKSNVVAGIIDAKIALGHTYTDEEIAKLREKYNAMSLDTLKAVYDELSDEYEFVSKFIEDSVSSQQADCNCPDKKDEQPKAESKPAEEVKQADRASNPVGFVNASNLIKADQFEYVKQILKIGGDIK